MRYFISIIFLFSLLACKVDNKHNEKKEDILVEEDTVLHTSSGIESAAAPDTLSCIDAGMIKRIQITVAPWLKYNKLNIADFMNEGENVFDLDLLNDKKSPYYQEFDERNDAYIPQLYDYSPDKRYYLNLMEAMCVYLDDDGKYHYAGSDDSQHMILYDRKEKKAVTICYNGFSSFIETVFWVNNNTFIFAGFNDFDQPEAFVDVYDLKQKKIFKHSYSLIDIETKDDESHSESFMELKMKSRGIIIEN